MSRVLLVEDDATMRRVLTVALNARGYDVEGVGTGEAARNAWRLRAPDVMLLDLGLPDMDGAELVGEARSQMDAPIIVVSARSEEEQVVRAFDAGASDYVTKPFREGELMARLRAVLRVPRSSLQRVVAGDVELDVVDRKVFVAGREVLTTPTEFKLLLALGRHAGRVVSHDQLLREVWGPNFVNEVHYLRVFMKQLRQKVEDVPASPKRLVTALGVGYRLVDGPEDDSDEVY